MFNTILGVECAVEAQQAFPLVGVCVYLQTTDSSAKTEPYTTPPMEHYTHKHKMSLQEKKKEHIFMRNWSFIHGHRPAITVDRYSRDDGGCLHQMILL